jgi:acyl-CoA synthetase (AMP-forming)/AMP-acid ligase II
MSLTALPRPTPAALPLLCASDLAAPIAWRHGVAISAGQFIGEAQALAAQLPASGQAINLCQDRYLFALGLAAALLRGQTSLLPPNALPETLRQVPAGDGAPYALMDLLPGAPGAPAAAALDMGELPVVHVQRPPGVAPAREVPLIAADLAAVCLLTSGSTGAPQPHAKRWGPLVANIRAEAERLAQMLGKPTLAGVTLVATVPAQHSYGLESTVLLALLGGAAFEAGRPYFPADIAAVLAAVPAPRALVTTPFHLKTLLLAGVPLPAVDLLLSATAPLSPQLAAQAETAMQGQLIEIYGCTEAGQVASRRTTEGEHWTTLGELQIRAETGADGEQFIVRGGHVEQPTPLADVLVLDSPQRFRLLGRANDLIHVAGKRSSLAHLNFHLNRIEGVEDGAFWLPDEVAEGIVRTVAFVVSATLTPREVIAALRLHLEPLFVPRRVVMVAALPRVETGKLTAATLRRFALDTLAAQDAPAAPITALEADGDVALTIPANHPAFAGHFPGHPVLPGVALLSLVVQAIAARPVLQARLGAAPSLDNAKFLTPVRPGALLRLALREQGRGVAFELFNGDTAVARGQFSPNTA